MKLDEENLNKLQQLASTDFYRNDKEFLYIIKKLTKQSSSLSNKAVALASLLQEAEVTKLNMLEKEMKLGLSQANKPYGKTTLESVDNFSFSYSQVPVQISQEIEKFIYILENYFDNNDDVSIKKAMLLEANEIIISMKKYNLNPTYFIINPERSKVWHILDSDLDMTIRKHSIDLFIQKVRQTRLKHIDAVESLLEHNQQKKLIAQKLSLARKRDASQEEIDSLQNNFPHEPSFDIAPLLIDTQKLMDTLDFMIEEVPTELNDEQLHELKEFIPVLSEYYIDQTYALSGGNSFTTLAKNMQELQEVINQGASVGIIFEEALKLQYTMQHLYIVHWLTESLLKNILQCKHYGCTLGNTIHMYNERFTDTKTDIKKIKKAVRFRNDIAHNGVIWDPKQIQLSIENYRYYMKQVTDERQLKLEEIYLPKKDRELTEEQKKDRIDKFIQQNYQINPENFSKDLYEKIAKRLEKEEWNLNPKDKKYFKNKITQEQKDTFAQKYFELSFERTKEYMLQYGQMNTLINGKTYIEMDQIEQEECHKKSMGLLTKAYHTYIENDSDKNLADMILKIRKRIESCSDKKYEKDITKRLFGWMKI